VLASLQHRGGRVGLIGLPAALQPLSEGPSWTASDGWSAVAFCGGVIVLGAPATARRLDEPWGDGRVPDPLWAVLSVHDGIGPAGVVRAPFGAPRVLPREQLAPLTHWMRFGEENILYAPARWLRFTADPEGGWCVSEDGEVRRWSAADHRLGPPVEWGDVWRGLLAEWRRC